MRFTETAFSLPYQTPQSTTSIEGSILYSGTLAGHRPGVLIIGSSNPEDRQPNKDVQMAFAERELVACTFSMPRFERTSTEFDDKAMHELFATHQTARHLLGHRGVDERRLVVWAKQEECIVAIKTAARFARVLVLNNPRVPDEPGWRDREIFSLLETFTGSVCMTTGKEQSELDSIDLKFISAIQNRGGNMQIAGDPQKRMMAATELASHSV